MTKECKVIYKVKKSNAVRNDARSGINASEVGTETV